MYALKDNITNEEEIKGKGVPAYMVTTDQNGIDRRIREGQHQPIDYQFMLDLCNNGEARITKHA